MITELTKQQECDLVSFRDEMLAFGRRTAQSDRIKTEKVITSFYSRISKPKPMFFWFDGPATGFLAIELIKELWPQLKESLSKYNLWANLRDNLGANLWDNLGANLWDNLGANLRANLWDNLGANLRDNLGANLRANLGANLRANLGANLGANLWANLWANLRANLGANLRDNLGANLRDNLGANLGANLWANLRANLRANLGANLSRCFWGQHELAWIAFYSFCQKIGVPYKKENEQLLAEWMHLSQSTGWWCPFENICFCFERHNVLNVDSEGRLHCENGPSMGFKDGYKLFNWHGVSVPGYVITAPETITVKQIEDEKNAEVRRVMITRFGLQKYILESGSEEIQRDDFGILRAKRQAGSDPIMVVQVVNATPESDGSYKDYFLQVDSQLRPLPDPEWSITRQREWLNKQKPQAMTAHAAVASTFGLRAEEYAPEFES